jgi:uncharacterized protein (DUF302 family)
MSPQKLSTPISATRITFQTSTAFSTVESRLTSSIRQGTGPSAWPAVAQDVSRTPAGRADFISAVEKVLGPHGFMEFFVVNHGAWLPIYGPETSKSKVDGMALQCKRFILGNPLIAITMLEHDVDAGLFVPVEVMLVEDEEGVGCRVLYMLPSGLVAGYEGASEQLVDAAKKLDEKLEVLIRDVIQD